jgi:hypothetical protein
MTLIPGGALSCYFGEGARRETLAVRRGVRR